VKSLPYGLDRSEIVTALATGWDFAAESLEYAPLGFGSYHWVAITATGERRFVTVDDLDHAPVAGRDAAFARLTSALDAAHALRHDGRLDFVVAPLRARDGATVRRMGARFAIALYPFVDGVAGVFGDVRTPAERDEVVDVLVALHDATRIVPADTARIAVEVPGRDDIERALGDLGTPWSGGPYSEPARAWLADHLEPVRAALDEFDRLATAVAGKRSAPVITHGEPHPGNFVRTAAGLRLVDWDTAGLAPPERDLWMVADGSGAALERYAAATGHPPDESALELSRLSWDLSDVASYLRQLRSTHEQNEDSEQGWAELRGNPRFLS
jgi:spectinomycin phosphotransferase